MDAGNLYSNCCFFHYGLLRATLIVFCTIGGATYFLLYSTWQSYYAVYCSFAVGIGCVGQFVFLCTSSGDNMAFDTSETNTLCLHAIAVL